MQEHADKVLVVQKQTRSFFDLKERARVFHGNTNTTRNNQKNPKRLIDISALDGVIEVNVKEMFVVVEPNVSMNVLVDVLLPLGFAPPVVPEFPSITVGGAVQGGAGESSSFKYGCVNNACVEYEIVLANGTVTTASKTENLDLYNSIPGSCGSIGVITLVKMRIVPAKPFIKLTYQSVNSYQEAVDVITEKTNSSVDFIDGIMYSKTHGVIMMGSFCQEKQRKHATFHKPTDDWFYLHAQRKSKNGQPHSETIPTKDYYFRYDKGGFWVARYGFSIFLVPFTRLSRFVFAGLLRTKTLYSFLHGAKLSQAFVIQDICLPEKSVVSFMEYNENNLNIYPLWLCPLKPDSDSYLSPTFIDTRLVINVGIWGKLDEKYNQFVTKNRELETKVAILGGRKVLYAHAYYTEPEFWDLYDEGKYIATRRKYNAEITFPSVYEKTHVAEKYKPSIFKGLMQILSSDTH